MALALSSSAFADQPPVQGGDISQQINDLKARLAQLEANQKQSELKRAEAEQKLDAKITSDQLAHDAEGPDHFLSAEGFTAGYSDGRFVVQSADGNFVLRPWLHMQFRDVTLYRENINGTAKHPLDETDNGFEMRRLRFGVDGNMFSPDFQYFFNWATVRASGSNTVTTTSGSGSTAVTSTGTVSNNLGGVPLLEEAWVKYHIPTTPYSIKLGQIKDPVLHDQIVSSRYQQGAERSLTADIFTNGDSFTEGATFIYDPDTYLRAEAGVNHGMRSANTNFLEYPNGNAFNFGVVGRVEYKVMGRWKDYAQIGAVDTKKPLLVFGLGSDYSERGHSGQLVSAADVMYGDETGLNLYGAFVNRYTTHNFGAYTQSPTGASIITPSAIVLNHPTEEYSIVAEGGYIIEGKFEPFGRYEFMHVQGDAAGLHNWLNAVTGGVNYYFHGHRVKITVEATWLPQGMPFDDGPNDVLANKNGDTEVSFIAQLQLLL